MSAVELNNLGEAVSKAAEFAETKAPSAPPDPPAEPSSGTPLCDTCGEPMALFNEKWANRRIRMREWVCKNNHVLKETAMMP